MIGTERITTTATAIEQNQINIICKSKHLPQIERGCPLTPLNTGAPGVKSFTFLVTYDFKIVAYEFTATSPLTCISMLFKVRRTVMMNL